MTIDKDAPIAYRGMPTDLKIKVEAMTPLQRKYCEYRVKGLKQADAAEKAGSTGCDRASLAKVGWNIETQAAGAKEYMMFLHSKRAQAACIDEIEIVTSLRGVIEEAMLAGKFGDAVKAIELMGNMIGAFQNKNAVKGAKEAGMPVKNNLDAFKHSEDSEEDRMQAIDKRMEKINSMMVMLANKKTPTSSD